MSANRPVLIDNGLGGEKHITGVAETRTVLNQLHWHNFFELVLIADGEAEEMINGKRLHVKKGYGRLVTPSDYHQLFPITPIDILVLSFDESILSYERLQELIVGNYPLTFTLETDTFDTVKTLFQLCIDESLRPCVNEKFLNTLTEALLIKILDSQHSGNAKTHKEPSSSNLRDALLYLHTHFREQIELSDVAKIFHYNTCYFSSAFHKEFKMTFVEYLTRLRIDYAKKLLISTDLKIIDICYRSGFSSLSTFSQTFKKQTGQSPSQYRVSKQK